MNRLVISVALCAFLAGPAAAERKDGSTPKRPLIPAKNFDCKFIALQHALAVAGCVITRNPISCASASCPVCTRAARA